MIVISINSCKDLPRGIGLLRRHYYRGNWAIYNTLKGLWRIVWGMEIGAIGVVKV